MEVRMTFEVFGIEFHLVSLIVGAAFGMILMTIAGRVRGTE